MYSKETYSKEKKTYSKETYSKETYSKETYSKEMYSKETYSKEMYSKETYSKETYSTERGVRQLTAICRLHSSPSLAIHKCTILHNARFTLANHKYTSYSALACPMIRAVTLLKLCLTTAKQKCMVTASV
jgi:hypothetical protein